MSLKFRDEEERQELVRLHAEVYRRARHGDIKLDVLQAPVAYAVRALQKGCNGRKKGTIAAQKEQE